jgi:hypothetical protein
MAPDSVPDPLAVALQFAGILERLGVRYVTAGSLASSLHGEPRSTNDIDFVADLRPRDLAPLVRELGQDWAWSEDVARVAIDSGRSFNAVHIASAVKVDVFIVGTNAFDTHRVATGLRMRVDEASGGEAVVDTAEHSVVRKLEWFRRGGETSDRQWRDVVGILRTQGARVNDVELDRWAHELGVADLLAVARREASS